MSEIYLYLKMSTIANRDMNCYIENFPLNQHQDNGKENMIPVKSINFAFGIHNHQPVGNFDSVFEESYERAYLPFLECLEKHPFMKVVFHNSGPIWDYYQEEKPEWIEKIRNLVKEGRMEMLSGGYYEPILVNIADRDKIEQIKRMNRKVRRETGTQPRGMWCAERVWEPHLAKPISLADIKYVILDEYHIRSAGFREEDIFSYHITDEQGFPLAIFPTHYFLRYKIPYGTPEEVMEYLEKWASEDGSRLAFFADDGEKFGVWPQSYRICWEEGWLDKFFNLLEENKEWINVVTLSEYMDKYPPKGRAYPPTASYFEMSTWALPAKTGVEFNKITDKIREEGKWDEFRNFLRGGFWRNFLAKYPESNHIQKKALFVSEKVSKLIGRVREEALTELFMGQCNCAYWHGVFGGIYLPHLRHAIQEHLINAGMIADEEKHGEDPFKEILKLDLNRDMQDEIIINTQSFALYFLPHIGGALNELDYKPEAVNYCDTMTRRPESYHENVKKLKDEDIDEDADTRNISDLGRAKEKGLKNLLKYDRYDRHSFLDHFIGEDVDIDSFRNCEYEESGDFIERPYEIFTSTKDDKAILTLSRKGMVKYGDNEISVEIEKTFFVPESGDTIQVQYWIINESDEPLNIRYGCEMDFSILSKDMDTNFIYIEKAITEKDEERIEVHKFPLDSVGEHEDISRISIQDGHRFTKIHIETEREADKLWRFPIETVSMSEEGFEKIYQSTVFMPLWNITLEPGDGWENNMKIIFEPIEEEQDEEEEEGESGEESDTEEMNIDEDEEVLVDEDINSVILSKK